MYFKQELNIIPSQKSLDKYNRKTIPKHEIHKIPKKYKIKFTDKEKNTLNNAINYVKLHFPENPGIIDIEKCQLPMNHTQARDTWLYFINNKLNYGYADYQDYMYFNDENPEQSERLYHSGISSSMNIGLINPHEIIADICNKKTIRAVEAFIRQLFWREYQLYCFRYCKNLNPSKNNYFGGTKKLNKSWYDGTLDIYPLDYCIKKAFNTGYLHHIERLMIVGNFMLLYGISPREGFKWFMEFSTDSYEWVMKQNVYHMVFYISGRSTTTRPYISSSNYIIKMSNLKKSDWSDKWDKIYKDFLIKNKSKLTYPYT